MDAISLLLSVFFYCFISGLILLIILSGVIYATTQPYPIIERSNKEGSFYDPKTRSRIMFSRLQDDFSVNLSVVVPAYNEQDRLPSMLDEAFEFLETRSKEIPDYKYEIIVVSDGSRDKTVQVAESYVQKYGTERIRCLELEKNRGKGGAVRLGVLNARGATILFADADGASKFEDIKKLEVALMELLKVDPTTSPSSVSTKSAIVIGSRAHLEKDSLATRSIFRNILMYGFHFLVWIFTVKGIKDTQCGFKMFTRKTANQLFQSLHVNRWAFDVELLYIAQKLNIPIVEIPVRWTEIEGSKVTPVISWIQMGIDLGLIWLKYTIGAWKIKNIE
ncbi:dolichyl-phosphate beta-glucosyltransferase [Aricia agestis]|uniref:dolichyl-phosphate beta-glucosyltransferase n=1 Tax=Aricia agestis TaxID=91739 RepID=UPI001C2016A4|nr:dolichyl-phosphate beta-glucosyltransferase [Aricia agestis]